MFLNLSFFIICALYFDKMCVILLLFLLSFYGKTVSLWLFYSCYVIITIITGFVKFLTQFQNIILLLNICFIGLSYYVTNFIIFVQLLTFVNLLLLHVFCIFNNFSHTTRAVQTWAGLFWKAFLKWAKWKITSYNHTLQVSNSAIRLMFWVFKLISSVFHNSYLLHDAEWVCCYAP